MDADEARVRAQLVEGERLLWVGRPDPRVIFTPQDLFVIPFTLLWAGVAITLAVTATFSSTPAFAAFGSILVVVGVYVAIGRFFYKAWNKGRTVYAITNFRAQIFAGRTLRERPVFNAELLVRDGREHISVRFGTPEIRALGARSTYQLYANTGMDLFTGETSTLSFFDVADVVGVRDALAEIRVLSNS